MDETLAELLAERKESKEALEDRIEKLEKLVKSLQQQLNFHTHSASGTPRNCY